MASPASSSTPNHGPYQPADSFTNPLLNLWLGGIHVGDSRAAEPLRFSLWELLAAMTVAAVLLALFRALGIVGAAAAFVAALALTQGFYPAWNRNSLLRQEAMFDFVWGALMPIVCLTFDPFVFKFDDPAMFSPGMRANPFETSQLYPWSLTVYAVISCQIACLSLWLVVGRLPPALAAVLAGVLWVGFALACVVGVVLLLPAAVGSLFAIGAIGFTPLFTARAFYRRALQAGGLAIRELPPHQAEWRALVGYWLGIIVPAAVGTLSAAWLWSQGFLTSRAGF